MNSVKLRDFPTKTLKQVSALIDKRIRTIRYSFGGFTPESEKELANLLEFQTQIEYALQLVKDEDKVTEN